MMRWENENDNENTKRLKDRLKKDKTFNISDWISFSFLSKKTRYYIDLSDMNELLLK